MKKAILVLIAISFLGLVGCPTNPGKKLVPPPTKPPEPKTADPLTVKPQR